MGMIGIIDPSNNEYKYDTDGRLPNWYTLDEILQLSRFKGPKWSPWQYELLFAALDNHQERDYISTTMLVGGCPRSKVLERKVDYIGTIDSLWPSIKGSLIHRTLEHAARPGSLAEVRFFAEVEGIPISCSPDLITAEGDLYDYKNTEKPHSGWSPWRNHTQQVMYNAYIVRHATHAETPDGKPLDLGRVPEIKSCTVTYLEPKGPNPFTLEKKQPWFHPKTGKEIERLQPYVWTDEEVLDGQKKGEPGLVERITAMQDALDTFPVISPKIQEVWGGPNRDYKCSGFPWCKLPNCLAKKYPDGLVWPKREED